MLISSQKEAGHYIKKEKKKKKVLSQTRFGTIFLLQLAADFEKRRDNMCGPTDIMGQKLRQISGRKEHGQMGWSPEGRIGNGRDDGELCLTKFFQPQEKSRGLVFINWMEMLLTWVLGLP